jgi:hypothetical protein
MPIIISTYCRVNRNGSMDINTDPAFFEPPYTGPICVSGAGVSSGTYTFLQYYTQNFFTRPEYISSTSQFIISISYTGDGRYGLLDTSGDDTLLYEGLTFPPPLNPYLETSWTDPSIVITQGPC